MAENDGTLHYILQFANISRPSLRLEQVCLSLADCERLPAQLFAEAANEMCCQGNDILLTFSQWRNFYRKDAEPVKEIFPEPGGFDSVVLSTTGAVARGTAVHTIEHDGAVYYFASQLSADIFSSDPESYLPQYGGFCAYAVAFGRKFDGDPRFADIVDGKLYLFVIGEIFEKYLANKEQILADAARNWPSIQHKAVGKL